MALESGSVAGADELAGTGVAEVTGPAAAVGVFLARPEDAMAADRDRGISKLGGAVWAAGILRIVPATIGIVAARLADRTAPTRALVLVSFPLAVVTTALPVVVAAPARAALVTELQRGWPGHNVGGGRRRGGEPGDAEQGVEDAAPADQPSYSIEARVVHAMLLSSRSGAGCAACELAAAIH